jgi:acyl dehydratase
MSSRIRVPATFKVPFVVPLGALEVGKLSTSFEITITREDVQRWTRIHGDDCSWYREQSPWGGPVAPGYILYYASQNLIPAAPDFRGRPNDAIAGGGGLARYSAEFLAPLPIGRPIYLGAEVTDKYVRRGRGFVNWSMEASVDGNVLQRHWKSWTFSITPEEAARLPERGGSDTPPEAKDTDERFGPLEVPITEAALSDFEGPGHPDDTTHTNVELAPAAGFPNVRAQGGLIYGLLYRLMRDRFGASFEAGGTLDARFVKSIYAGETLAVRGAIVDPAGVTCRIRAENPAGEIIAVGNATAKAN